MITKIYGDDMMLMMVMMMVIIKSNVVIDASGEISNDDVDEKQHIVI